MRPLSATLIGVAVASVMVLTASADTPQEIAARVVQAQDENSLIATWDDWHPEAVHRITIKYGMGQNDDVFSYKVADASAAGGDEIEKAMEGYVESGRSAPDIATKVTDGMSHVTAVTRVDYDWQSYKGRMVQTDEFVFAPFAGGSVIRSLTTTYDYR